MPIKRINIVRLSRKGFARMALVDFVKKRQAALLGEKYLFLPKANSTKLLIVFSSFQMSNYTLLRNFKNDRRLNVLFLRDTSDSFYTFDGRSRTYRSILKKVTERFKPENITTFGISMGGSGAFYHGLEMNANVVAINPVIDFSKSRRISRGYPELYQRLNDFAARDLNKFKQDIGHWVERRTKLDSVVYAQFSSHEFDRVNSMGMQSMNLPGVTQIIKHDVSARHFPVSGINAAAVYQKVKLLNDLR